MISARIENNRSWVAISLVIAAQFACSGESQTLRLELGDAFARCVSLRRANYLEYGARDRSTQRSFQGVIEAERIAQSVGLWGRQGSLDEAAKNWRRYLLEANSNSKQAERISHCDRDLVCAPMEPTDVGPGLLAGAEPEIEAGAARIRACAEELTAIGAFREQAKRSVEAALSDGSSPSRRSAEQVEPLTLSGGPADLQSPRLGALRISENAVFRAWVGFDPKRCPNSSNEDPRECEGLALESVPWSGEYAKRRLDSPEGLWVWQDLTIDDQGRAVAYGSCRTSSQDPMGTCILRQGIGGASESVALKGFLGSDQQEALRGGTDLDVLLPGAPKWAKEALSNFSERVPEVEFSAGMGDIKWGQPAGDDLPGETAWTPQFWGSHEGGRFAVVFREGAWLLLREGQKGERSARKIRVVADSFTGAKLHVLSPERLAITGGERQAGLPAWVVISDDAGETWAGRERPGPVE